MMQLVGQPKVSVIVPMYEVEQYLRQALDSVIGQTLTNIEIIIVDDGSPDRCPEIADDYAKADSRITVIHQKNGGYGAACNAGLTLARGEYIAIFEPDDYLAPTLYEKLCLRAQQTNADIVKCDFYTVDDASHQIKVNIGPDLHRQNAFALEAVPEWLLCQPSIWAAIYRSTFLKANNITFVEAKGAGFVDINFKYETFFASRLLACVAEPLYFYRVNEGSSVKKRGLVDLEYTRWREVAQMLALKYAPRAATLRDYINANRLGIVKWALLMRLVPQDWDALLALWQQYFATIDDREITDNRLLSRRDRQLFFAIKRGDFAKVKTVAKMRLLFFRLGAWKRQLISVRVKKHRWRIQLLPQLRLKWSVTVCVAGCCYIEFRIGKLSV